MSSLLDRLSPPAVSTPSTHVEGPSLHIARTRELTTSETACSANGHLVSEFRRPLGHTLLSGPCCCLPGALSPGVRGQGGHSSAQAPPHRDLGVMVGVAWTE